MTRIYQSGATRLCIEAICEGDELFAESTTDGMLEARVAGRSGDLVNAPRLSAASWV
jgi:hypothetical protein